MRKKIRNIIALVLAAVLVLAVIILIIAKAKGVDGGIITGLLFSVGYLFFAFIVLYFALTWFFDKYIFKGLKVLIRDMNTIADGNLNIVSCVRGNEEFEEMSRGINRMVKNIVRTSGMLSRVFDLIDAQFAVFEFNEDSKGVTVTDRLGTLLNIHFTELAQMVSDKDQFRMRIGWIMKNPIPGETDVFAITNANSTRYVRIVISKDGDSTVGMVSDVTDEIKSKQAIIKERDYDALTKIRNRRSFERDVTELLNSPRFDWGTGAMIMIDLDKFKGINDNYGHAFGDEYLQRAAGFISRFAPADHSIVARRSGDEFYLVVYGYKNQDDIRALAGKYYQMLADEPIDFPDGTKRSIGMSMGIAWYNKGVNDFNYFLKYADDALYEAKETGRNTYGETEVM